MDHEMPVYYSRESFGHNPPLEIDGGEAIPHKESVNRLTSILDALRESNFTNINITAFNGMPWVEQVHTSSYLRFLAEASQKARIEKPLIPSSHPYGAFVNAGNFEAALGLYVFDTYTPIMPDTRSVALESAATAVAAAQLLRAGEPLVYALTRPPGHHSGPDYAGGYCYLNNVAVASKFLLQNGAKKLAILDIDYHHGNGTQDIFYENPDVFVLNIHAHPKYEYPGFSGYENERGRGEGEGTNLNLPFPAGINEAEYDQLVQTGLTKIVKFKPDYLVVSAGFDTHEGDPSQSVKGASNLKTDYYQKLGRKIASLGIPVLSVQEGGYNTEVLGTNVVSYLKGLTD